MIVSRITTGLGLILLVSCFFLPWLRLEPDDVFSTDRTAAIIVSMWSSGQTPWSEFCETQRLMVELCHGYIPIQSCMVVALVSALLATLVPLIVIRPCSLMLSASFQVLASACILVSFSFWSVDSASWHYLSGYYLACVCALWFSLNAILVYYCYYRGHPPPAQELEEDDTACYSKFYEPHSPC